MQKTVNIKIGQGMQCTDLPNFLLTIIKKNLTFKNPQYESAMKRGAMIPQDMPAFMRLYDIEENQCWLPRGYIFFLLQTLRKRGYKVNIQDHTLLMKPLNIKFHGKLKPYQAKASNLMMKYPIGVLEGGTGSGKTVVGISVIARRKQTTLVIVHSKDLMYQWQDELKFFLKVDCGLVGDKKFSIKPITVAIINSVNNNLKELTDHFGQIIVDECHRISADSWSGTLQEFPAKHYLGLTATPFRRDGLGAAIFASIGPKIHTIDKKMLYDTKAILRPDVYRIPTRFRYAFADDYSTMIKTLTKNIARNRLICSKIARDLKVHKENIVVVSDRTEHCYSIQKMLSKEFNINALVLVGTSIKKPKFMKNEDGVFIDKEKMEFSDSYGRQISADDPRYEKLVEKAEEAETEYWRRKKSPKREEIVKRVKEGKCKVVIATIGLIGEGFDAPNLTALFITTPLKFTGRIIQLCGRVLRFAKNKIPRIYDFRDNSVEVLLWSGYQRDRVYKKEWG